MRGLHRSQVSKQPREPGVPIHTDTGHSMRRIARDCRLDRSTVKNILTQPEIEQALQQSRDTVLAALPAISQMVTADILRERDRELGFQVLKNAGALPKEDQQKAHTDNRLQIAIQTLFSPAPPPGPIS